MQSCASLMLFHHVSLLLVGVNSIILYKLFQVTWFLSQRFSQYHSKARNKFLREILFGHNHLTLRRKVVLIGYLLTAVYFDQIRLLISRKSWSKYIFSFIRHLFLLSDECLPFAWALSLSVLLPVFRAKMNS